MQFIDLGAQRERLGDRLKAAIDRVVEGGKYILGPEVAEFEKPARGLCRRQACHRLRQRHRCAAAAALCGRHRTGRRGVRAELHLRRDRRGGGAGQGRAGVRRRRSRHLQYRHRQPRSGDRHGQARRPAAAEGDHPGRPVRARRRLRCDRDRSPQREEPAGHRGRRAVDRRHARRPQMRFVRQGRRHQLLSGQAARLLRRRRRDVHQRRRARRKAALARLPWQGRDAIRQHPCRRELAPRHAAGGDPDREAGDPRRRDGRPPEGRGALFAGPGRHREGRRRAGGLRSAWAQYAIETPDRDALKAHLQSLGIPTVIYYVKPLHEQVAYRQFPRTPTGLPVSESAAGAHPVPADACLSWRADQDRIIDAIRSFVAAARRASPRSSGPHSQSP